VASEPKHTPGPWSYFKGSPSVWATGETSRSICTVSGPRKREDPERHANGELIAASPDLLLVVKTLAEAMPEFSSLAMLARAAIDKAEGRDYDGDMLAHARRAALKAKEQP
jgi:hypothetical protein